MAYLSLFVIFPNYIFWRAEPSTRSVCALEMLWFLFSLVPELEPWQLWFQINDMCFGNSTDDSPIPLSLSKLSEAVSVTPAAVLGLVGLEANSVAKLSNRNLLAAPFPDPDDTEMAESVEARFCVVEVSIFVDVSPFPRKTAVVQLMSSSCWLNWCTCLLLAKNQEMHKCLSVSADDILYPWAVISLCVYLQVSWNISIFLCVSCLSWSLQATEILVPRFLGGWGDGTAGFFFGTDQERFTTGKVQRAHRHFARHPPNRTNFFSFSAVGSHSTSYSPLEVASSKKKRQVQTAVLCIGNVVVLFCYIPAQKSADVLWTRLILIPTS